MKKKIETHGTGETNLANTPLTIRLKNHQDIYFLIRSVCFTQTSKTHKSNKYIIKFGLDYI
jgi:hypothetical protein